MTIVFDENVSHHLVELLAKCGAPGEVQHLRKLRWNAMPDAEWMHHAVEAGFPIVTADRNEKTRALTAADLRSMGARVLFLGAFWDHLGIWDKTKWLVARWEVLNKMINEMPAGECAVVNRVMQIKRI